MYNMPMPISVMRNRMRQEFERNRFVSKLSAVDVLLFKSHAEYQVRRTPNERHDNDPGESLTIERTIGDDELLEADDTRHVVL